MHPPNRYRALSLLAGELYDMPCNLVIISETEHLVKSMGGRVPACSAESFHTHATETMPETLQAALMPLVGQVAALTTQIRAYDKQVEALARRQYPKAALLGVTSRNGKNRTLAVHRVSLKLMTHGSLIFRPVPNIAL
jgi:hypothetical protein